MLYDALMQKAIEATIITDNGTAYLIPEYRNVLRQEGLDASIVSDAVITNEEIWDYLKLEVERRKVINSKREMIFNWLYDIISLQVDPALTQEENELFKNMMEYMELNGTLKDKEAELQTKEEELKSKEQFIDSKKDIGAAGFNFAKRKSN